MRALINYILLICVILVVSCKSEIVEPIDIFETESLRDTSKLNIGSTSFLDIFYVNPDRVVETTDGYHVKGTLFAKSMAGVIPITSGDFKITTDPINIKGYGTAGFPKVGFLEIFKANEVSGSDIVYKRGQEYKVEKDLSSFPINDGNFYFWFKLDYDIGKTFYINNIRLILTDFYLLASDPAVIFKADLYTKNLKNEERLVSDDLIVGLSVNYTWQFAPFVLSGGLDAAISNSGFEEQNGNVSITGKIPVLRYPLIVNGTSIINTSNSNLGELDFFYRGFDDASYTYSGNGEISFTNQLVPFLTFPDSVLLSNAQIQIKFDDVKDEIRLSGSYENDYLSKMISEEEMQKISYNEQKGTLYAICIGTTNDFEIYIEEKVRFLSNPGITTTAIYKITKDGTTRIN